MTGSASTSDFDAGMKFNTPLPQPLPKECSKAAKIFKSFVDGSNHGLDGVIPRAILEKANGFLIFTVIKAGFLFSARAGSGVVIAKLSDGNWSAPSAIGSAGLGVGGQAGAEVTDFLVVLNSISAVKSFMSAGSLTLGGNMSIALGPLGRNGEAAGSLNSRGKMAAMYSYSKTRGLFGGLSVEGSVIVERQDANALAYGSDVTAKQLLSGAVEPPNWADPLIKALEACTGLPGTRKWVNDDARLDEGYAFGGLASPDSRPSSGPSTPSYLKKKKKSEKNSFPPASWSEPVDSYFPAAPTLGSEAVDTTMSRQQDPDRDFDPRFPEVPRIPGSSNSMRLFSTNSNGLRSSTGETPLLDLNSSASSNVPFQGGMSHRKTQSSPFNSNGLASMPFITPKPSLEQPLRPGEGVAKAIALYDFAVVESGDLPFKKGDIITVTRKSGSTDDWWQGRLNGKTGNFPANFVEVV